MSKSTCSNYIVYGLYHKIHAFLLRLLHLTLGISKQLNVSTKMTVLILHADLNVSTTYFHMIIDIKYEQK